MFRTARFVEIRMGEFGILYHVSAHEDSSAGDGGNASINVGCRCKIEV